MQLRAFHPLPPVERQSLTHKFSLNLPVWSATNSQWLPETLLRPKPHLPRQTSPFRTSLTYKLRHSQRAQISPVNLNSAARGLPGLRKAPPRGGEIRDVCLDLMASRQAAMHWKKRKESVSFVRQVCGERQCRQSVPWT